MFIVASELYVTRSDNIPILHRYFLFIFSTSEQPSCASSNVEGEDPSNQSITTLNQGIEITIISKEQGSSSDASWSPPVPLADYARFVLDESVTCSQEYVQLFSKVTYSACPSKNRRNVRPHLIYRLHEIRLDND